jgi:7-cyano-7-deazaguanine synthase
MAKNVVVSLSGGMDSSTLLLRCLSEYDNVTALSFDYGQKHRVELERAQSLVDYINGLENKAAEDGQKAPYNPVKYQVIKLDGLVNLLNSNLVQGGDDVPEGHYEEDNMKATVVPNRNKIFASLVQAVALSAANANGNDTDIALGIHAGDHAIYPDCRQEFRDADDAAFRIGNWEADKVGYFTPYLETDKLGILKDGEKLVSELGIEFDEVYKRTNTSYKPYPSGNSDYKSASSVERIEAFINLGRKDPVQYEDETGPVDYEVAKTHVEKLLAEYTA